MQISRRPLVRPVPPSGRDLLPVQITRADAIGQVVPPAALVARGAVAVEQFAIARFQVVLVTPFVPPPVSPPVLASAVLLPAPELPVVDSAGRGEHAVALKQVVAERALVGVLVVVAPDEDALRLVALAQSARELAPAVERELDSFAVRHVVQELALVPRRVVLGYPVPVGGVARHKSLVVVAVAVDQPAPPDSLALPEPALEHRPVGEIDDSPSMRLPVLDSLRVTSHCPK